MTAMWSVRVQGLGKCYAARTAPLRQLWRVLAGSPVSNVECTWVLRDVSFTLAPGEVLGVIGVNGAGKSTLLQLLAGVTQPSEGRVEVRGRTAALLELGAGFSPELTGRENVILGGLSLGLSRQEIEARLDEIIEFAGLARHIDRPVRTYSSGMTVRLAFSVATSIQPDVLIIDEALSVGDGLFAKKSFDRIQQIRAAGATVIFCSHALYHIECFCHRVLWLHDGRIQALGDVPQVLTRYRDFLDDIEAGSAQAAQGDGPRQATTILDAAREEGRPQGSDGAGAAELTAIKVACDGLEGGQLCGLSGQSTLDVTLDYRLAEGIEAAGAAVVVSSDTGRVLGTNFSLQQGILLGQGQRQGRVRFRCERLPLNKGRYRIGVYLTCERGEHVYHWIDPVAHLEVRRDTRDIGCLLLPGQWDRL